MSYPFVDAERAPPSFLYPMHDNIMAIMLSDSRSVHFIISILVNLMPDRKNDHNIIISDGKHD